MNHTHIKYWSVFGERNSGTKYLVKVLNHNFPGLKQTEKFGFKHWFFKDLKTRDEKNNTSDLECVKSLDDSDDTLFLFIVREPYSWIQAMFARPYHILPAPNPNGGIRRFLEQKISSYTHSKATKEELIEVSKNIIELRNRKNEHFWSLGKRAKYFSVLRLENLQEDLGKINGRFEFTDRRIELPNYRPPMIYQTLKRKEDKLYIRERLDNTVDTLFYGRSYDSAKN